MPYDPHDAGADFILGAAKPPKSGVKDKHPSKSEIRAVADSFKDSANAGEVFVDGLIEITGAGRFILGEAGLSFDALCMMVQKAAGNDRHGREIGLDTVGKVIRGLAALDQFLDKEAVARRREREAKARR